MCEPLRLVEAAVIGLVAGGAAVVEEGCRFFRRRLPVRIVASGAAHHLAAGLVAATRLHLFYLAHGPPAACPLPLHKHHQGVVEMITGPEVIQAATITGDRRLTCEMALIADRLAACRIEVGRIDDSAVLARFPLRQLLHHLHVLPARPMAPLAADARLEKDRLVVAGRIFRIHRHLPGMAVEAAIADGPLKTQRRVLVVARGKIPSLPIGIPADRRLGEPALLFDHIGPAATARTDGKPHRHRLLEDDFAIGVSHAVTVVHRVPVPLHEILMPRMLISSGLDPQLLLQYFDRRILTDRRHRMRHRVALVPLEDLRMTLSAAPRADVIVGARGRQRPGKSRVGVNRLRRPPHRHPDGCGCDRRCQHDKGGERCRTTAFHARFSSEASQRLIGSGS